MTLSSDHARHETITEAETQNNNNSSSRAMLLATSQDEEPFSSVRNKTHGFFIVCFALFILLSPLIVSLAYFIDVPSPTASCGSGVNTVNGSSTRVCLLISSLLDLLHQLFKKCYPRIVAACFLCYMGICAAYIGFLR